MHMQIGTSVNLELTKVEKDNCLMNNGNKMMVCIETVISDYLVL